MLLVHLLRNDDWLKRRVRSRSMIRAYPMRPIAECATLTTSGAWAMRVGCRSTIVTLPTAWAHQQAMKATLGVRICCVPDSYTCWLRAARQHFVVSGVYRAAIL